MLGIYWLKRFLTSLTSGNVMHNELIGKEIRDTVESTRGAGVRADLPTKADYVTMTPRLVTLEGHLLTPCILP